MINSISFGAKFIKPVQIPKYNLQTRQYLPADMSFVQLEPFRSSDVKAVEQAANEWKGEWYARSIVNALSKLTSDVLGKENVQFYAITEQQKNFHKLNSHKILGMIEVNNYFDNVKLEYLQIKPELTYNSKNRKYKKLGQSLINLVESVYKKNMYAQADYRAANFYEKSGFEILEPEEFIYFRKYTEG